MPKDILIQVILPLRLEWEPCYWAPDTVSVGDRVSVSFAHRQYIAVVHRVGIGTDVELSKVQALMDADTGLPPVTARELALWEFISSYYLCTVGEVYYAAYPYNKLNSEKVAAKASRAVVRRRELEHRALKDRLERLEKRLLAKSEAIDRRKESPRSNADVTARLEEEYGRLASEISALQSSIASMNITEAPSFSQSRPVSSVKAPAPMLLQAAHRYDLYTDQITSALAAGRQVLVLTPDILYCKKLGAALSGAFPTLLEFTSKETPVRRRRISDAVREGLANVVVGTRSAIFLPFDNLGLIIVDEEQDTYYKQDEPAPRYNGRDCAVKLAQIHGSAVILGSECPSLETLLNATVGRYRVLAGSGPVQSGAEVIDLASERRKRGVYGLFTYKLVEAIRQSSGSVVLIRGWERVEDLQTQIDELFPGRDVTVLRWLEAREADLSQAGVVGVLQADALVDQDDFRADERGAQIVAQLASRCRHLLVQTNVVARFDGSRSVQDLLDERRDFGFPPYTRAVDIRRKGSGEVTQRIFLKKNQSLAARKAQISASLSKDEYVDVDPL